MKFSTVMAVFAVALAVVATGCKYDKGAKGSGVDGDGANGQDISSASDINGGNGSMSGSLSDAAEGKFEDLYKRCTDVNFEPVYFGFDSTVVPQGELGKIDAVAQHLNSRADRVVVVEGNCDERGSNEYNISLGNLRAISIRDYLVTLGVADARVQTKSYGEEKPAVAGSGEEAWALNRRGEFAIFRHK